MNNEKLNQSVNEIVGAMSLEACHRLLADLIREMVITDVMTTSTADVGEVVEGLIVSAGVDLSDLEKIYIGDDEEDDD